MNITDLPIELFELIFNNNKWPHINIISNQINILINYDGLYNMIKYFDEFNNYKLHIYK